MPLVVFPSEGLYRRQMTEALDGPPDLVISDMAANTVGHKQTDHLRTMGLVETAAHFAISAFW